MASGTLTTLRWAPNRKRQGGRQRGDKGEELRFWAAVPASPKVGGNVWGVLGVD
jgi:hypothetical protein